MLYRHWLNLNVHLLWCHQQPIAKGWEATGPTLRFEQYSNSGAWLVQKGWACVEHDNEVHVAQPGQWLIVKPGKRVQTFASDTLLLSVGFDARWPDGSHLFDDGLSLVVDAAEAPALERHALLLLQSMKIVNPDTWDARDHRVDLNRFLSLQRRLCDWLQALADVLADHGITHSGQTAIDERVSKAVDLLQAHALGERVDIEQIAAQCGISVNHLTRLFRQELRTTPREYWDHRRLEYARGRLAQPNARIKEIAIELGFTYLSHFSKWFKTHTGTAPSQIQ